MRLGWPEKTYLIDRERRFVFCPIPKVACSDLLRWCLEVSGESARAPGQEIHAYVRRHRSLEAVGGRAAREALRSPEYFKFVFVRHPFARLVAAYTDTFLTVRTATWPLIGAIQAHAAARAQGRRLRNWFGGWRHTKIDDLSRAEAERSVTFRQFIEYLAGSSPRRFDSLWRPQSDFVQQHRFDFVGYHERLDEDFALVQSQLQVGRGLSVSAPAADVRETSTESTLADAPPVLLRKLRVLPEWPRFFTADLRATAEAIYATDFADFGYAARWDGGLNHGWLAASHALPPPAAIRVAPATAARSPLPRRRAA